MDLTIQPAVQTDPALLDKQQAMRDASEQVEGLFLKILLKEGMKSMVDEAEGHSSAALSYAIEKTAEDAGRAGTLGIADQIYEQLSSNL